MKKENEGDARYSAHGLRELTFVKMSILPKAISRLNVIPNKVTMAFFIELGQLTLKFMWNHKTS